MTAIVVSEDCHTTAVVRFCVLPSVKTPVAENCWKKPVKIVAEAGVTKMDSSTTGVTVSVVDAEMVPDVAFIVVVPIPREVASPFEPVALLINAIAVAEEFHVTDDVRSCVELSENVPVAIKCKVLPRAMLGLAGVTVKDVSTAGITVSSAGPEVTLVKDDVIEAVPTSTAVALPFELVALLMVATPALDVDQVATVVNVCVFPFARVPVAVNCCVVPLAMLTGEGVTTIDDRAEDVSVAVPDAPA